MAEIAVNGLTKTFGRADRRTAAVTDVSFCVPDGELLVLLGPSGCGKSTTLRCLAGLEEPDDGSIRFGERRVYDRSSHVNVPAHRRDLGLVFQSFALWPHMTAWANVEFPLKSKGIRPQQRVEAVRETVKLVALGDELLAKRPGLLSGGQQQRVALARALAGRPSVLLFDEPLSSLDAMLREQLRIDLKRLHQRLGFSGVYVTHDLTEAFAVGDRVAIMDRGRIEQVGAPAEVFRSPASAAIAQFLGLRPFTRIVSSDDGWHSESGTLAGAVSGPPKSTARVELFARPEVLRLTSVTDGISPGCLRLGGGRLTLSAFLGSYLESVVSFGDNHSVTVRGSSKANSLPVGSEVAVEVPVDDVSFYDTDGHPWELRSHA